ncbi:MAG: TfoX/Sxy family protein [Desulfobacterales bacterium]|nr:TfoX/Sxy family protein [Desulfobacterales bacterium]
MAYDDTLAERIRELLRDEPGIEEKKMFGGICVLLRGNMACGILNEDLIVRVGPENYQVCLEMDHTRVFDITGRVMKNWVMVSKAGYVTNLAAWVNRGLAFAETLPPKPGK